MTKQINTDKNLTVHKEYANQLETLLTEKLVRFEDYLTRLEIHLSDENGNKDALNDKKCLLEARLKGRQPIVTSALGNTYDQAIKGAIDKIKVSLDTIIGKLRNH
ncbi:HPF/RaiA family ribosome-associated protein [Chondrinema litorale]|uniref:HPF/RaiA family ribosome-associated protein n=1 Tax=Chondrinema litorale TaxID=2994555 RepID=UPI002543A999|nr:HPF/RaiA family ribosome-associated protein [Chondrinema litorale]UZR99970.1 HPF/RaiA family ribosome-associated protein [Chondrinema litorale]